MNKETLFRAIGDIDEELVAQSEKFRKKDQSMIPVIAALLALGIGLTLLFVYVQSTKVTVTDNLVAAVIVNGETYYESGWRTEFDTCPEGFLPGGTVNETTADGKYLLGAKFFTNSAIPEWIYVYAPVWDEANHESMKFVRFVTEEARFHTLISYEGVLYESLWTHGFSEEDGDPRIETLPAGFVLVGVSYLEELDRVPRTDFGVNHSGYDQANVYADPENPEHLYLSATWVKYIDDQEVQNNGYQVFVRVEEE